MSGLRLAATSHARDSSVQSSATGIPSTNPAAAMSMPAKHTSSPIVTGSSVIGLRCVDGVVIGADTLASYGSLARFRDVSRLHAATDSCVLGVGGDLSDFDQLKRYVEQTTTRDHCFDDGHMLSARALHQYLARIMYNRRNKMDPLWNRVVVAGIDKTPSKDNDNETTPVPMLGLVDLVGTHFESPVVATGFGEHLGLPLLRKAYRPDITVEEGKQVVENILKVLFYRDARTIDRVQIATVTKDKGVEISQPFKLDTKWDYKSFIFGARIVDDSTW